jgi:PCRF domain
VQRLTELVDAPAARAKAEWLAGELEKAWSSLEDWDERLAEEGGGAVWLLLRNADPLEPATEWLQELVAMHQGWCRRLGLASELVAVGFTEDVVTRAVLEVEGPGAASYLAMEQGVHRLHRERGDLRVRVDVLPRESGDAAAGGGAAAHRTASGRAREALGIDVVHVGRVDRAELGLFVELGGPARETVEALLADVDRQAQALVAPLDVARVYAQGGTGARDPRTDAVVRRFKDAMRGGLDPLLQAWRRRGRSTG